MNKQQEQKLKDIKKLNRDLKIAFPIVKNTTVADHASLNPSKTQDTKS